MKITQNDLLEAMRQAIPVPPGPEWMTLMELCAELKLTRAQGHKRIQLLTAQGVVERQRAPNRDSRSGQAIYYRIKKPK